MLCLPTPSHLYISSDKMGAAGKAFSDVTQFCYQAVKVSIIFAFWCVHLHVSLQTAEA